MTAEWSPDGRRFLTATVAPRLNVDNGKAVQDEPMKSVLNLLGTKRLKLKYDELLSSVAFKFKLRRYITASRSGDTTASCFTSLNARSCTRQGLHSSTFRLNVSAFRGIGGAIRGCLKGVWEVMGYWGVFRVYFVLETAQVELKSGRV